MFPEGIYCISCGRPILPAWEDSLCPDCRKVIFENRGGRCPRCGSPLTVNFADSQMFFQTRQFQKKMQDYQNFVLKYHGKNLVFLELGVGWRNRMIKEPLMQLAASEPNAVYITFNKGELYIPDEIQGKSIGVDGDIAEALHKILRTEIM